MRNDFQWALASAQPMSILFMRVRLRSAPMDTMTMLRTRALLTDTTVLHGSPAGFLSAPARGSTAIMAALAFTGDAVSVASLSSGAVLLIAGTQAKDAGLAETFAAEGFMGKASRAGVLAVASLAVEQAPAVAEILTVEGAGKV